MGALCGNTKNQAAADFPQKKDNKAVTAEKKANIMWIDHEGTPFKSDDEAEEAVEQYLKDHPELKSEYTFKGKHKLIDKSGSGQMVSQFALHMKKKPIAAEPAIPESGAPQEQPAEQPAEQKAEVAPDTMNAYDQAVKDGQKDAQDEPNEEAQENVEEQKQEEEPPQQEEQPQEEAPQVDATDNEPDHVEESQPAEVNNQEEAQEAPAQVASAQDTQEDSPNK